MNNSYMSNVSIYLLCWLLSTKYEYSATEERTRMSSWVTNLAQVLVYNNSHVNLHLIIKTSKSSSETDIRKKKRIKKLI